MPPNVIAVTGLAFEARIAAGPGVNVLCATERSRLLEWLEASIAYQCSGIISFGIAGGLDCRLSPGDWPMLRPGLLLPEICRSRPAESFSTPLRVACRQPRWFPSVVTEHLIWAVCCVRSPETQSKLRIIADAWSARSALKRDRRSLGDGLGFPLPMAACTKSFTTAEAQAPGFLPMSSVARHA
jgi:hypothetical protein